MMRGWTIPRIMAFGFGVGALTCLFRLLFAFAPETYVLPYVAGLLATAATGLLILLVTYIDTVRNPRRGSRIRPIRGFDIAAGLLLAVPALWGLTPFLSAL